MVHAGRALGGSSYVFTLQGVSGKLSGSSCFAMIPARRDNYDLLKNLLPHPPPPPPQKQINKNNPPYKGNKGMFIFWGGVLKQIVEKQTTQAQSRDSAVPCRQQGLDYRSRSSLATWEIFWDVPKLSVRSRDYGTLSIRGSLPRGFAQAEQVQTQSPFSSQLRKQKY